MAKLLGYLVAGLAVTRVKYLCPTYRPLNGCTDRVSQSRAEFGSTVGAQLDDIQHSLLDRARRFRDKHTHRIDSETDLYDFFTPKNRDKPEIHAGFALSH